MYICLIGCAYLFLQHSLTSPLPFFVFVASHKSWHRDPRNLVEAILYVLAPRPKVGLRFARTMLVYRFPRCSPGHAEAAMLFFVSVRSLVAANSLGHVLLSRMSGVDRCATVIDLERPHVEHGCCFLDDVPGKGAIDHRVL